MANICSVTMYFHGEKSAVEDLHEYWTYRRSDICS